MSDAATLKNEGNAHFTAGRYEEAAAKFTAAIALDASNHVLYSNRSGAYAGLSKWAEALSDADRTVALKDDWAKGYARRGAAYVGLRKYSEAVKAYERAVELEPGNAGYKESLEDARGRMEEATGSNIFTSMFADPKLLDKMAANPRLRGMLANPQLVAKIKMLQANPALINSMLQGDRDLQMLLVGLLGIDAGADGNGDGDGGADAAAAAASADAGSKRTHAQEQQKPEPPKQPEPAPELSEEERAAKEHETKVTTLKERGNEAYKKRSFDEAIAAYEEALVLDPKNVAVINNVAAVQFEQGKFDDCIATCHKAIEIAYETRADLKLKARAYSRMGSAYHKLERFDEAIKYFNKSMTEQRTPETLKKLNEAEAAKRRYEDLAYRSAELSARAREAGNEAFKRNDFPEAVKHYTEAIKRNPEDHVPYSNRAAAYTKLGALQEALRDCDSALAINPTFVKAYSRKGTVYFMRKEYHNALEAYRRGIEIDEHNAECREGLERTMAAIQMGASGDSDEERVRHAMADPEIQALMSDPMMRQILQDLNDPKLAAEHLANPVVRAKINKLIAAGIIRTG